MLKRRTFIRLAGGGIIAVAGGALAAWKMAAVPDSATEAWRLAGQEAEPRRWALAHALLAPNPHNLQPWMADLSKPGEILLSLDPTRTLPATDPYGRQIMMGAGAFLELLSIAAAEIGYRTDLTLFPDGEPGSAPHERPFARIALAQDPAVPRNPLFKAIADRRTERGAYDPERPAAPDEVRMLQEAVSGMRVAFDVAGRAGESAAESARLQEIRRIVRDAWRVEMSTEQTFMESMRLMRVGGAEIDRHRDGIALADAPIVAAAKMGLFDRGRYPGADSMAIKSQLQRFDGLTASTPSYLWISTDDNSRTSQIEAGRAYGRLTLAGSAMGLAFHPNEQALQEYPEMAANHAAIHRLLTGGRPGHTVQMLARLGRLPKDVLPSAPAPRRGLEAHLRG